MQLKDKIRGALRSWTIWANAVFAALLAGLPMLQDSLPALAPFIDPGIYKVLMGVVIAANILLRFRTSVSLAEKTK